MRRFLFLKKPHGFAGIVLAIFLWPLTTVAEVLAVVYPEIREPYRQVFISIAAGVARLPDVEMLTYEAKPRSTSAELDEWLAKHQVDGVIALGNAGVSLATSVSNYKAPIVVGAVAYSPELPLLPGILLNPSPETLFKQAKALTPKLQTIHVVYESAFNQSVIDHAESKATRLGLELKTYPVSDLRQAAESYRGIQREMNPQTDAIWLPMGGPARDKAILQTLLEQAWAKDQMIISSNLSDVRRGAMLALYPNNEAMGHELGQLLLRECRGEADNIMEFSKTLMIAINLRTADHLGIRFSKQELKAFDFVYPPP